ncbi:MAG: AI-2E family transporter [Microcystaceae cyanobacterium]
MKFGEWIGFTTVLLIGYFMWQMRQLLLLVFTAIVLAIALNLLVRWLRKRQISRGFAILLSFAFLFLILLLSIWIIVPPFVNQFQQLVQLVPQGIDQFIIWLGIQKNKLDPVLIRSLPQFEQQDFNEILKQLQPIVQEILGGGLNVFYSSLGLLLSGLLLFALSLMLLASPNAYRQGFIRLFPAFYRPRIDDILLYSQQALENWLKGIVVNMGIVALFTGISLLILQIPLALSQSIIAGFLTFIPHLGLFLSVIPPIATLIALQAAPWKIWGVLILYIGIQQIETNILTKRIQARQVSLLPGLSILAQIIFTIGFGILGLILALPLSIISQICIREILVNDILNRWEKKA